jgi:hypothetical protein
MQREAVPNNVVRLIERNISMLNSMLQHEFTHIQQLRRNPQAGNYPIPAGKNVYVNPKSPTGYSRSNYANYDRTTGRGIGSKERYTKSLSRKNPSTDPRSQYLGQPEEVAAHARGAAEYLKNPHTDVEGHIEIAKYLALGREHPAFKLFVRHLLRYMNNDSRAVTQAIAGAERRMRR